MDRAPAANQGHLKVAYDWRDDVYKSWAYAIAIKRWRLAIVRLIASRSTRAPLVTEVDHLAMIRATTGMVPPMQKRPAGA